MIALELMTRSPAVIAADDTIANAADLMRTRGVGMLPVVDSLDELFLVGVITDRDIVVRHVALGHGADSKVRAHMTVDPLVTAAPLLPVSEVVERMTRFQVRRVPVVDARGVVIGVIAQADLARQLGPDDPELVERVVEAISRPGALVR